MKSRGTSEKRIRETGGWGYTEPVSSKSAPERSMIASGYPWVSMTTMTNINDTTEFTSHQSDIKIQIIKGTFSLEQAAALPSESTRSSSKLTTASPDNEKEKFSKEVSILSAGDCESIPSNTNVRLTLLNSQDGEGRSVEGYEVLSPATRDLFLKRCDIEWVEGGEHEGRVGKDFRDKGNVSAVVVKGKEDVSGSGRMEGNLKKSVRWMLIQDSADDPSENSCSEEEEQGTRKRKAKELSQKTNGVRSTSSWKDKAESKAKGKGLKTKDNQDSEADPEKETDLKESRAEKTRSVKETAKAASNPNTRFNRAKSTSENASEIRPPQGRITRSSVKKGESSTASKSPNFRAKSSAAKTKFRKNKNTSATFAVSEDDSEIEDGDYSPASSCSSSGDDSDEDEVRGIEPSILKKKAIKMLTKSKTSKTKPTSSASSKPGSRKSKSSSEMETPGEKEKNKDKDKGSGEMKPLTEAEKEDTESEKRLQLDREDMKKVLDSLFG